MHDSEFLHKGMGYNTEVFTMAMPNALSKLRALAH